jgi:nitrous oxidase accessory protein NosD
LVAATFAIAYVAYVAIQPVQSLAPVVLPNVPTTAGLKLYDDIYIWPDGSLYPAAASNVLSRNGDVYTFTENILNPIFVERDNTILEGAGYTLQGQSPVDGIAVTIDSQNCTVRNIFITSWNVGVEGTEDNNTITTNYIVATHGILIYASNFNVAGNILVGKLVQTSDTSSLTGISLYGNSSLICKNQVTGFHEGIGVTNGLSDVISANDIVNNSEGLTLSTAKPNTHESVTYSSTTLNVVSGNNIANCCEYGVSIQGYNNIMFFSNNFVNNSKQVFNENEALGWSTATEQWDNGTLGNYWSDYQTRYPHATEIGGSGIENMPYSIFANNADNYPLVKPISIDSLQ